MDKHSRNKKQREHRLKTRNAATKIYEKTKKGFLMRAYRNMKSRILGVQKTKFHLYKDKNILSKNEFYEWSLNNNSFNRLFDVWTKSNFDRRLTPSVDRIDTNGGYTIQNMEWIEFYINCSRGGKWKPGK